MSSTNIDHQIFHYQGDTFVLQFNYFDENDSPIDLTDCMAEMHIRRSPQSTKLVAQIKDTYPEGCFGMSGGYDFEYNKGITGTTGGIILNYEGVTGEVFVLIDSETLARMPATRNFYDINVNFPSGEVRTILKGTFELARETTR